MHVIQGIPARSAETQRWRHLLGAIRRNSEPRGPSVGRVEYPHGVMRKLGGSPTRYTEGTAVWGRDSREFRPIGRNSAKSPPTWGDVAEFHGDSTRSITDPRIRNSARCPQLIGDFAGFRSVGGRSKSAHSPKKKPGGASADNRSQGRAGKTDADRERTNETTATDKTCARRATKELKLTKPPNRQTYTERSQKP